MTKNDKLERRMTEIITNNFPCADGETAGSAQFEKH